MLLGIFCNKIENESYSFMYIVSKYIYLEILYSMSNKLFNCLLSISKKLKKNKLYFMCIMLSIKEHAIVVIY